MRNRAPHHSRDQFSEAIRSLRNLQGILLDKDGTILNWNDEFELMIGYSEEDIKGQRFSLFFMPLQREAKLPEKLLEIAASNGKVLYEGRQVRKDGTTYKASTKITAIKNDRQEIIGFIELTKKAEENDAD